MKCPECGFGNTDTAWFWGNSSTPLTASEDTQPSSIKTLETLVEELGCWGMGKVEGT